MGWMHLTTDVQTTACDALVQELDTGSSAGYFNIYAADGDGIPGTANTAVTNQTLLAKLFLSDPACFPASNGVATAGTIASVLASGTGTAAWARFFDSDNVAKWDVDVGATGSGAYLELDTTAIVTGNTVAVQAMTFTMPSGET